MKRLGSGRSASSKALVARVLTAIAMEERK